MFYICIPGNIVSISNVWNYGNVIVFVNDIKFIIKINTFTNIIRCNHTKYFLYKINSDITSGIYYKITTTTNESYLITNNQEFITNNNYNTISVNNNIYDNGIATIYHDKSEFFVKIGDNVIELNL